MTRTNMNTLFIWSFSYLTCAILFWLCVCVYVCLCVCVDDAHSIPYEERVLFKFYGDEYLQYRRNTTMRMGIPFIASPMLRDDDERHER